MLILIILGIVALVGLALIIIGIKDVVPDEEIAIGFGAILFSICLVVLVISGGIAISTQVNIERYYEEALNEKATLEYFIATADDDILRNEQLYNHVITFNARITKSKYKADSPWIGIWINKKIGTIDYINLSKENQYERNEAKRITT